jgi:FkbH-like protein
MHVVISPVTEATIGRVAQLTQKTNQFNVTTHRYTQQELALLMVDPAWRVYALQASDRFGDNGIVGVAILHYRDSLAEIDTLLLSCRVIGRTVETALLATLAEAAACAGAKRLVGWFRPTTKNAPAQEFYPSHEFTRTEVQDGATRWELDLRRQIITPPAWIARQVLSKE